MSLRIGFDATPLHGQRSGVGYYTANLLCALSQELDPENLLLFSNKPLGTLEPEINSLERIVGSTKMGRFAWMQAKLPGTLRRAQPMLAHFPNAMAPLCCPVPYVLTIHDASLFRLPQHHPLRRHLSIRLLLPHVARKAAAVIADSDFTRREILDVLDLDPKRVHVVHLAASESFRPISDEATLNGIRERYALPKHFILFSGNLDPRKNLIRLVRAYKKLHQHGFPHKLIFVGQRGWHTDELDAEIERLELQAHVELLGYVPEADLPGILSLADVFTYPSLYEGFGLPPLEAMACGTPVIASRGSSLTEVCGDAALLVDPEDEDELSEAMSRVLEDPNLREKLSYRGLENARKFSWRIVARETLAVYQQVLGR